MIGFISKMFGGSKSEKDVKAVLPLVSKINQNFQAYQSISNDELRNKKHFVLRSTAQSPTGTTLYR